ncbi:hypothetical protein T03_4481 [Trichinella britovi]|uniref:Uncharacterized protein n=1 Tax=Trichinella britovi TaxID=45882 RepID=A0A0V1C6C5_TRIBR|nr:hypothetical protein T03_4481 [Trichinella britovi]
MSCFAIVNRLGNFLLYAPKSSFDLYHRFSNGVLQNIVTTGNFLTIIPGILQTTNDVHAGSTYLLIIFFIVSVWWKLLFT